MSGTLAVVCGPPGVGKTTVAEAAADRLGATLLRTDVVRKELVERPTYADRETERTYAELFDRAGRLLAGGERVVLDGTFRRRERRDRAAALAAEHDAGFRLLRVTCEPALVRERIRRRESDASDADVAVYEQVRAAFEPLDRARVVIDNSGSPAETRRQVATALGD